MIGIDSEKEVHYSFCKLVSFPISGGIDPENKFPSMLLSFTCITMLVVLKRKESKVFWNCIADKVKPSCDKQVKRDWSLITDQWSVRKSKH